MGDDDNKPTRLQGSRPDRVRLIVLVYRKQGMSFEDFQNAWRDDFAPVFAALPIVKKNLLTYEQVAIYEASSYEKLFECFEDEEFVKTVTPEEEKLLDGKRSLAFPVDIVSIFDDPT
ncbi:hypothetical protein P7C71_g3529, partial [Lecanoromycetidae sp. Uapishka_2]